MWTFDYETLRQVVLPHQAQLYCFLAFALAFCIKVPLFPFHTWLPDAHVEAPTAGSVILAAVMLKFGGYGLLRFAYPLFPWAAGEVSPYLAVLAVIGIIYGSLVAFAQTDIKKLIAYSSVAHLGFVVLGIAMWNHKAIDGAVYQMLAHGISTGALFLCVGVLYERRHTRRIDEYGGIATVMPKFLGIFLIITMASIGLPTLSGFVGEFLILLGTFQRLRQLGRPAELRPAPEDPRGAGDDRRHPGRRVHAVPVPEGHVRAARQPEEQAAQGSQRRASSPTSCPWCSWPSGWAFIRRPSCRTSTRPSARSWASSQTKYAASEAEIVDAEAPGRQARRRKARRSGASAPT